MRCAEQTLAKYATQGCGPEFHRYGRDVVYAVEKLDEWAESRLSKPVRSTSQTDTPGAAEMQSASHAGDRSAVLTKGDFRHPEASATPEEPSRSATPSSALRAEGGPENQPNIPKAQREGFWCRNPESGKRGPGSPHFSTPAGQAGLTREQECAVSALKPGPCAAI